MLAGLLSLALCVSIELIQFYDWGRQTTLTDLYLNVLGGLIGAWIALCLPTRFSRPRGRSAPARNLDAARGLRRDRALSVRAHAEYGWYQAALSSLWRHPQIDALSLARAALR